MFDNSFQHSDTYFTALQLLRIFADEIRSACGPIERLRAWVTEFPEPSPELRARPKPTDFNPDSAAERKAAWDKLMTQHATAEKGLLERIEKLSDEITGLRDGVRSHDPH